MRRRDTFRLATGAAAGLFGARAAAADARIERAVRGLPSPKIKDVNVIATAPDGIRLVVVKITTIRPDFTATAARTFTQRADLVVPAVEKYLKPFLIGKTADRIDDIWQACYDSSYWRNGPVLNNAISGVDQALWDIKGRQAGCRCTSCSAGRPRSRRLLHPRVRREIAR